MPAANQHDPMIDGVARTSALDSAVLPWHDARIRRLHETLTYAYPSARKARDLMQTVEGFPAADVNWDDEDGVRAVWQNILTKAARRQVLRKLLERVLDDPAVAGHHKEISCIVAEFDRELPPARESLDTGDAAEAIELVGPRPAAAESHRPPPIRAPDASAKMVDTLATESADGRGVEVPTARSPQRQPRTAVQRLGAIVSLVTLTILITFATYRASRWPLIQCASAAAIAASSAAIWYGRPRLLRSIAPAVTACAVAFAVLACTFVPWADIYNNLRSDASAPARLDHSTGGSDSGPPAGSCVHADLCRYLRLAISQEFDLDQWRNANAPQADLTLSSAGQLLALGGARIALPGKAPVTPADPRQCQAVKTWHDSITLPPVGGAVCVRTSAGHLAFLVHERAPSKFIKFLVGLR